MVGSRTFRKPAGGLGHRQSGMGPWSGLVVLFHREGILDGVLYGGCICFVGPLLRMYNGCELLRLWRKAECLNHLQVAYSTDYLDELSDIGQSSILNQPCAAVLF